MKEILSRYPSAYAIYDIGEFYGVGVQESFYLLNKNDLSEEKVLLRYEPETLKLINIAIPIWFADDLI